MVRGVRHPWSGALPADRDIKPDNFRHVAGVRTKEMR
jgi:hypothetical protein